MSELVELAHSSYTSILKYNNENALSCVLTMAYFTAPAYYNVIREFPSGVGIALMILTIVYLYMILSTVLKLQVIIDRDIWKSLFLLNCDNSKVYIDKVIGVDYFLTGCKTGANIRRTAAEVVKESDIEKVEHHQYFKEGGRLYHSLDEKRVTLISNLVPETSRFGVYCQQPFEKDEKGNYFINLYGADDFVFSNMEM